ncbi:hypothetical protein NKH18_51030 [Streptomyces sp. M10(2022)]
MVAAESRQRRGQLGADGGGTSVEIGESVEDPGVIGRDAVVVCAHDTVDDSELPCRAEVEQLGVEKDEPAVRRRHGPAGIG